MAGHWRDSGVWAGMAGVAVRGRSFTKRGVSATITLSVDLTQYAHNNTRKKRRMPAAKPSSRRSTRHTPPLSLCVSVHMRYTASGTVPNSANTSKPAPRPHLPHLPKGNDTSHADGSVGGHWVCSQQPWAGESGGLWNWGLRAGRSAWPLAPGALPCRPYRCHPRYPPLLNPFPIALDARHVPLASLGTYVRINNAEGPSHKLSSVGGRGGEHRQGLLAVHPSPPSGLCGLRPAPNSHSRASWQRLAMLPRPGSGRCTLDCS